MKFWSFGRRIAPLALAGLLRAAEPAGEAAEAARTVPANPAALTPAAAAPARIDHGDLTAILYAMGYPRAAWATLD